MPVVDHVRCMACAGWSWICLVIRHTRCRRCSCYPVTPEVAGKTHRHR